MLTYKKTIIFLYHSNEKNETEIIDTMPFLLTSPRMKHLATNPTKCVQGQQEENYKPGMKEIKALLNTWCDIPCS